MSSFANKSKFSLSKKPRSDYTLKSSSPSHGGYDIDIPLHQNSEEPCLYLLSENLPVASARRCHDESYTFVIKTTPPKCLDAYSDTEEEQDLRKPPMAHFQRWGQHRGGLDADLRDGTIRKLAWKHKGVYGQILELQDTTTGLDIVLATFTVGGFLDRGGKMEILVDWGVEFERIVAVSLMLLLERQSFLGKTYCPRGGAVPIPVARFGGETNLGAAPFT